MTNQEVIEKIKNREKSSSKYTYGKTLLVCGKPGMMGAAILASRACFRIGAGLVVLSCDQTQHILIHEAIPEVMCIDRNIDLEGLDKYAAIGFGCGAGKDESTLNALKYIFNNYKGSLVLDADGLTLLAENPRLSENHKCKLILTPHVGEAARLLNISREEVEEDREKAAKDISKKYDAIALVKGDATKIYSKEEGLTVNDTGNAGMATAGSGDVLTGVIAGLLSQGIGAYDAARAGAYIHGMAGDIAAEKRGMVSLMASDIIDGIIEVLL